MLHIHFFQDSHIIMLSSHISKVITLMARNFQRKLSISFNGKDKKKLFSTKKNLQLLI